MKGPKIETLSKENSSIHMEKHDLKIKNQNLPKDKTKSKKNPFYKSKKKILIYICIVIVFAVVIFTEVFDILKVTGNGMEPNMCEGDFLLSSKYSKIKKGDIIAFYYDDNILIKRIIATQGDIVDITDEGDVFVNSTKIDENYIGHSKQGSSDINFPYQVPSNCVFVLGDNRSVTMDSRNSKIGSIPEDTIIGKIKIKLNSFVTY